jgi:thiol-disulfide isomerase/thioredoxin
MVEARGQVARNRRPRWSRLWLYVAVALVVAVAVVTAESNAEGVTDIDSGEAYNHKYNHNIYEIESLLALEEVVSAAQEEQDPSLLVVIFMYKSTCAKGLEWLETFRQSTLILKETLDIPLPFFVQINTSLVQEEDGIFNKLSVTTVPSLLFLQPHHDDWHFLDYTGLTHTPTHLAAGLKHYIYRLHFGNLVSRPMKLTELEELEPMRLESLPQLQQRLQRHPAILSRVSAPLDPHLSQQEQANIQYLFQEDQDQDDRYVVIVQCQLSSQEQPVYQMWDLLASALSLKRNALFAALTSCDQQDGTILVFHLDESDYTLQQHQHQHHRLSWTPSDNLPLQQFVTTALTPSILWLDRQMTAPIAFPQHHKIHAVLFVDGHRMDRLEEMRESIRRLRRVCRAQDMICLVVPSTDTRVLTTFGIDIWTPLDPLACGEEGEIGSITPVLPVLVITDQRKSGTRRYYLDPPAISQPDGISNFVRDFWEDRATPELKSGERETVTKYNVQIWTADKLQEHVQSPHHTLLLLYAPTCGHCKRFSIVWNQLAQLLQSLEWDVEVAKMDLSQNEITLDDIQVLQVPDVYYFAPKSSKPAQYAVEDALGDGVGRISDPLELIDWFLDVSGLDDQELLEALEAQEE